MSIGTVGWRGAVVPVDPVFVAQACTWMKFPDQTLLNFVWMAHEQMLVDQPVINGRDLERSITQLIEPRIRDAMSGYEPFYVQHGVFEHETMANPPAQPPEYDLAFVWRADERVLWPMEAKVLETPGRLADYDRDIRCEFLTCRYAPFTASGAMLGYLLSGSATDAFKRIQGKIGVPLERPSTGGVRAERLSRHTRTVPPGKTYPESFNCHHLILEYSALRRSR